MPRDDPRTRAISRPTSPGQPVIGHGKGCHSQDGAEPDAWQRLLAELLGTFALTTVAAGGEVIIR